MMTEDIEDIGNFKVDEVSIIEPCQTENINDIEKESEVKNGTRALYISNLNLDSILGENQSSVVITSGVS